MTATTSPSSAAVEARPETGELGGVGRDVADAGAGQPEPQVGLEVLDGAAAQVVGLVGGDDVVGPQAGDLADAPGGSSSVRSPAVPRAEVHPRAGRREPAGDVEQGLEAGLVVGHVEDDRDLAARSSGSV